MQVELTVEDRKRYLLEDTQPSSFSRILPCRLPLGTSSAASEMLRCYPRSISSRLLCHHTISSGE